MVLKQIDFLKLAGILANIDSEFRKSWPVAFAIINNGERKIYEKGLFSVENVYGETEIECGEFLLCEGQVLHVDCDSEVIPMLIERCEIFPESEIYLIEDGGADVYLEEGDYLTYDDVEQMEEEFTLSEVAIKQLHDWAEDVLNPKVWARKQIKEAKSNIRCLKNVVFDKVENDAKTFKEIIKVLEPFAQDSY